MPQRAIRSDRSPRIWDPSNRIEPLVRPSIPMIARKVVVLPVPLRPSRVTTWPAGTTKSMPCRICDSPYQPSRPATSSKVSAASAMAGSDIGFDHGRVARDLGIEPFGQDLAAGQHGDDIG